MKTLRAYYIRHFIIWNNDFSVYTKVDAREYEALLKNPLRDNIEYEGGYKDWAVPGNIPKYIGADEPAFVKTFSLTTHKGKHGLGVVPTAIKATIATAEANDVKMARMQDLLIKVKDALDLQVSFKHNLDTYPNNFPKPFRMMEQFEAAKRDTDRIRLEINEFLRTETDYQKVF